jgi:regulator of protease activity HflC (stomatin/prohibitin superfamily)
MRIDTMLVLGVALGVAAVPLLRLLLRGLTVEVDDGEAAIVTRFGRMDAKLSRPGLHVLPCRLLPWVQVRHVSLRKDFRVLESVHVNDARGTTVIVDLWIELRVADPEKALFAVADWDRALTSLVTHAASSILSNREFTDILKDTKELGELLRADLAQETARWGLAIELAMIGKVSLLPEISRQIGESVSAQLERAKAAIDEDGRLRVAELEAATQVEVSARVAEAKASYPQAIGRAMQSLEKRPRARRAYNELYALNQVRPHRTVAFRGFGEELSSTEAAMILTPAADKS